MDNFLQLKTEIEAITSFPTSTAQAEKLQELTDAYEEVVGVYISLVTKVTTTPVESVE